MGIRSFKDKESKRFFENGRIPRKTGWSLVNRIVKRKLDMLHYSKNLQDLKSPLSNCLERLRGDLRDFYSIRINKQWRVIFKWDIEPFDVKI